MVCDDEQDLLQVFELALETEYNVILAHWCRIRRKQVHYKIRREGNSDARSNEASSRYKILDCS